MAQKDIEIKHMQAQMNSLDDRFNNHLEIYRNNGKELAAVKTNQAWLMRFFWALMSPTLAGIAYIISQIH